MNKSLREILSDVSINLHEKLRLLELKLPNADKDKLYQMAISSYLRVWQSM